MKTKKIIFVLFAMFVFPSISYSAKSVYFVTQNGAGSHSGLSITNAWGVDEFNDSNYWSSIENENKIDPGDIVYFSGKISEQIEPPGNGEDGIYIELNGSPPGLEKAILTVAPRNGGIKIISKKYLKILNWTINAYYSTFNPFDGEHYGIYIYGSKSNPSQFILIDNNEITKSGEGAIAWGRVENITFTRNKFSDLNESGISVSNFWDGKTNHVPSYITIGGSIGMGNSFINIGHLDSYYDTDAFIAADQVSHLTISYNIGYCDKDNWGMAGIYGNEVHYALVEYNIFHGLHAEHRRSAIGFKGDQTPCDPGGPFIVRYNHLWDVPFDDKTWGFSAGITASYNWAGLYIYGNYIHDIAIGISANIAYDESTNGCNGLHPWADNIDSEKAFIYSNIISKTQMAGIRLEGQSGGKDKIKDIYVYNNTINKAATLDTTLGSGTKNLDSEYYDDAAIIMYLPGSQFENSYFINNLITQTRPYDDTIYAMNLRVNTTNMKSMNNHYYDSRTSAVKIRYENEDSTGKLYDWNSIYRPRDDGTQDSAGNPYLKGIDADDFRLTSDSKELIGSGADMGDGNITSITINGKECFVPWDFALGSGTVFHSNDPDKIVIDKRNRDETGWDKGAYSYSIFTDNLTKVQNVAVKVQN